MKDGLKNSLNRLRELSSDIYHQYVPIIDDDTSIAEFATPIINVPEVMNEFVNSLVNRIVYTQFNTKYFNNPLKQLEGDKIPLGYAVQDIYTNPAKGRQFNVNDFAGLLQKYEADVKVQYLEVNKDLQYPVSITRHSLKQAFTSWEALDDFINNLTSSLYNGAYIDAYNFTKALVSTAYMNNYSPMEVISEPTTESAAKSFVTKARDMFLKFSLPSSKYNAWAKYTGDTKPIVTWTNTSDVVFLIRSDILAYIDVNVLASSFNIDKATLMGNIIAVDNFDVYSTENPNVKVFDGSKIYGIMADRSWFKIREQDMYLDQFYNANNRVWNYYLNVTKMYKFSLFANGVIFTSEEPAVTITSLDYNKTTSVNVSVGSIEGLDINVTPANANTPTITYEIADSTIATITTSDDNDRHVTVTGVKAGTTTLTAKAGNVSTTLTINVTEE